MGVTTSVVLGGVKQIRYSKDWKTPKRNRCAIPSVYNALTVYMLVPGVIRCPSPRFHSPFFGAHILRENRKEYDPIA